MKRLVIGLTLVALGLLAADGMARGRGHNGKAQCVKNARQDFKDCKTSCGEDFTNGKAICINKDPACFSSCQDGRDECLDTAEQSLNDCLDQCVPPLDAARATCRTQCSCGAPADPCGFNPCFIGCMNPAQGVAFQCRNVCKDAFKLDTSAQDAIAACKTDFKSCVAACGPPSPSGAFLD
jgi:hypothetical protein